MGDDRITAGTTATGVRGYVLRVPGPQRADGDPGDGGLWGCDSGPLIFRPGRGWPGTSPQPAVVPASTPPARPGHPAPGVLRGRPGASRGLSWSRLPVLSRARPPNTHSPAASRPVHQLLSELTIHFMYFNLGRTFIWLKFPFRGLECAFHTGRDELLGCRQKESSLQR